MTPAELPRGCEPHRQQGQQGQQQPGGMEEMEEGFAQLEPGERVLRAMGPDQGGRSRQRINEAGRMKRLILRLRLYRLAAWLYETYRLLAKPRTHGALVALWCQGRLLLVRASYRRELSLPGGWINRGETAQQAAQRELQEELGLQVRLDQLGEPWSFTERSKRGENTVRIFALQLAEEPALTVDGLEILGWAWLTPAEALAQPITGHLREYLLQLPTP